MLNDLSSGKMVSRQTMTTVPQNSRQSAQNVNHTAFQQCTSNQPAMEQSVRSTYSAPWMPSTSAGTGTIPFPPSVSCDRFFTRRRNWPPIVTVIEYSTNFTGRWESASLYRNTGCPLRKFYGYHNTSGDLISPGDNRDSDSELWAEPSTAAAPDNSNLNARRVNLSSTLYHRMMAKKLMLYKQATFNQSGDSNLVCIWTVRRNARRVERVARLNLEFDPHVGERVV